jgi:steroid delta-isomerase-like uncharacterized protein
MGSSENRELVRRWIKDGWNAGDNEKVMQEVFDEDWIDGDVAEGPHGWEGVRAFVDTYRAGFPDISLEILQMVADDEFVAFRWRATGTHEGALFGMEPTGRRVSITGHTLHRVEAGLLKESWVQTDGVGLLAQLGATSLPG